jgi:MinD superfamily P-loop ATPase
MKVAVAGGKGGTGKTLVATALALKLSVNSNRVVYCDADAEGPNGRLFLHPDIKRVISHSVVIPALNAPQCSGCGTCQRICAYNAILTVGKKIIVFPELCHSCNACFIACTDGMLARHNRHIGNISVGTAGSIRFYEASLRIGEARVAPLISGAMAVVDRETSDFTIIDNPPGTSCAAVAGQEKADAIVLVTEPTPFGLHDLKLALALGRQLQKPMVSVLNRADLGDATELTEYLTAENVPLVARIPFDTKIATFTADGHSPLGQVPAFDGQIAQIVAHLVQMKEKMA